MMMKARPGTAEQRLLDRGSVDLAGILSLPRREPAYAGAMSVLRKSSPTNSSVSPAAAALA